MLQKLKEERIDFFLQNFAEIKINLQRDSLQHGDVRTPFLEKIIY